ncbi:phage antirepressor KilAC domain-containing protein [Stenotrophomonas sp. GD03819]|uniref:hypothetical protein n=1 Tax=Stenotrophomonas sp. GD03819 TaxID=2975384 RepID=UPI00244A90E3|nr:hypothetical protein [Stenotrophomonas sp. GD03819]MDH1792960.1 phage antirepressor KilAC domain-containing protein [Stenotrophomonas sp. GD03819]
MSNYIGKNAVFTAGKAVKRASLHAADSAFQAPVGIATIVSNSASHDLPEEWLLAAPVAIFADGVRFFTPTELGRRLGISAQRFNRLLKDHGLQEKRDGQWCPTEAGKAFSVLLQVHKKQLAGTDVQQLKWKESVLDHLDDPA